MWKIKVTEYGLIPTQNNGGNVIKGEYDTLEAAQKEICHITSFLNRRRNV